MDDQDRQRPTVLEERQVAVSNGKKIRRNWIVLNWSTVLMIYLFSLLAWCQHYICYAWSIRANRQMEVFSGIPGLIDLCEVSFSSVGLVPAKLVHVQLGRSVGQPGRRLLLWRRNSHQERCNFSGGHARIFPTSRVAATSECFLMP